MAKRKMACPECEGTDIGGYFDETSQRAIRSCNDCGYEEV